MHLNGIQNMPLACFALADEGVQTSKFSRKPDHLQSKSMKNAKAYLLEFAYPKIWSELSVKDREVLRAMGRDKVR